MTPLCRRRRHALRHRKGVTMSSKTREIDVTQRSQRTARARRGITMRAAGRCGTVFVASVLAAAGGVRAQQMQMPAQEPHHGMKMVPVRPEYPRMGRAQENAKSALVTLERSEERRVGKEGRRVGAVV